MEKPTNDFCVFILTHGRPDNVRTFNTLRKAGYDGPIYLVIDNEDKKADEYYKRFGADNVIMFDKSAIAEQIDEFHNFSDRRAIVYARNACFDIADGLGYTYFLELDDDYTSFKYRMNEKFEHPKSCPNMHKTLGEVIRATFDFYKTTSAASIAFSQGGDWFGGEANFGKPVKRKAMNSFFCSTERRFMFAGGTNEDVGTYTQLGARGSLFLTIPLIQLDQLITQKTAGGMSEIYLSQGTYVKSFYTILCAPSCVTIEMMGRTNRRMHHSINWQCAVPCIVSGKHKKL